MKLNVALAKKDVLSKEWIGALKNYFTFFKNSQGAFKGERKTYIPLPGKENKAELDSLIKVITTVDEKFEYFMKHQKDYLNAELAIEATNASGTPKANLVVEGEDWGVFSSLELLRLKSLIESNEFRSMHEEITVRSDKDIWIPTNDEMYKGRSILEQPIQSWEEKTTEKKSYILPDPNLANLKDQSRYTPQVAQENNTVVVGNATRQVFTGEWSQRQKAELLHRISELKLGLTVALKQCNEAELKSSSLTADKIFSYIYKM